MYSVLGDSEAQEKIRSKTPNLDHCRILKEQPNGCLSYRDPNTGKIGICPNNPYLGQQKAIVDKYKAAYGDIQKKQSLGFYLLNFPTYILFSPNFLQASIKRLIDKFKLDLEQDNLAAKIVNPIIEMVNKMYS